MSATRVSSLRAGRTGKVSARRRHVRPLPELFHNRELSWLEFNQRVLDEALDSTVPLLERVKFFCITHSNLDEFFEVRVAGLKQQVEADVVERSADGLTATEILRRVSRRVRQLIESAYQCWRDRLVPALAQHSICFLQPGALASSDKLWLEDYYRRQVSPVLTPLALDPAHPFPQLLNKSLNLIVRLTIEKGAVSETRMAIVQVPRVLPRLVQLPRDDSRQDYVFLADVIGGHLADLFPGTTIHGWWAFRVTRNSELYIDEEEVSNLLKAVENELHNRRRGDAVRLETQADCPIDIRLYLLEQIGLTEEDLFLIDGPVNPIHLMAVVEGDHSPELREAPFVAPKPLALRESPDWFASIRERDILMHHPYESFEAVVEFLQKAATDSKVLAIKQTLYRTGGDSRIVGALMEAAARGKQVTAVVELKARFDEANNIQWARRLEEAGVHVVWGLVGYKTHGKMAMIVRQDDDQIRRYLHLSTGNYNPGTARFYTDIGLLTCHPGLGDDVNALFHLLTGICQFQGTQMVVAAPFDLHRKSIEWIRREAGNARKGLPARIILKMNALVDTAVIQELYAASHAGVTIDLIVRGVCCLRPGVRGLSDRISVRSVVDRFLEHSRIYYFENSRSPEVWVASADWMPRNFFRRIEVAFPILEGNARERVVEEILGISLGDTVKARILESSGLYRRYDTSRTQGALRSQSEFIRRSQEGVGTGGTGSVLTSKAPIRVRMRKRPVLDPGTA